MVLKSIALAALLVAPGDSTWAQADAGSLLPTGEVPAQRVDLPRIVAEQQAATVPGGLAGKPFAPAGLTGCAEMTFYRQQWGLPSRFDAIGWRESNCRNEESVHTSCCWGYLQLNVAVHLRDSRIGPRYRSQCDVNSRFDIDSDIPLDKQRQMCAAAILFDVVGYSAWG